MAEQSTTNIGILLEVKLQSFVTSDATPLSSLSKAWIKRY